MTGDQKWNQHYGRAKSRLSYPDENFVRILSKSISNSASIEKMIAVDIGCGSGRHLSLLSDFGFRKIIGLDYSMPSLLLSKEHAHSLLINADSEKLPFGGNKIDIAVCWGSLHYSDKKSFGIKMSEIFRILKSGGFLLGTLRSSRDTFMRRGKEISDNVWITDLDDIKGSMVSFYDEKELSGAFKQFENFEYGLMERTPLGSDKVISHWYFVAKK
ncbi:MAG: class I SAM-dependent methyltransferase [Spirochaetes bacterium]|nr:class I SAM-dependent methyltransferase [Spirochaetota bacterium]